MRVLVIDGQGGRIGCSLIENIRKTFPDADITGVGINSAAAAAMLRTKCANQVATGENAVVVCCRRAEIIACPVGMVIADAMLGEVSPAIAYAVGSSPAKRILIPMNMCDTYVAGVQGSSGAIIDNAMEHLKNLIEKQ